LFIHKTICCLRRNWSLLHRCKNVLEKIKNLQNVKNVDKIKKRWIKNVSPYLFYLNA